jgi:antitoxin component YwqK of YwqJK toxin-antitoxin module
MLKVSFLSTLLLLGWSVRAQQNNAPIGKEGQFTFETDKPFKLLELDEKTSEPIVSKKKKPKRKTFYGIKTRKSYTRKGFSDKTTIELFYVLKKPDKPTAFVRDIYWYDYTRKEIRKTGNFDPKKGVLLHGPYKKLQGTVVLEEGIFYKGAKHGRWMKYDRQNILDDKEKYYKGWPKESLVTYYDPVEHKKVKEMIPIEIDEREGYYFLFHENGVIAVSGEYKWGQKVGDWIENYPNGKRKRILTYPKEPYEKEIKPFVRKEWDDKGREIFSSNKGI